MGRKYIEKIHKNEIEVKGDILDDFYAWVRKPKAEFLLSAEMNYLL